MKVVLVNALPPAGPSCDPITCSSTQLIAPLFGQLESEPAGIEFTACAQTLLLSKELCQVTLPKGSGLVQRYWGLYWG